MQSLLPLAAGALAACCLAPSARAADFNTSYSLETNITGQPTQTRNDAATPGAGQVLGGTLTASRQDAEVSAAVTSEVRVSAGHGWARSVMAGNAQVSASPSNGADTWIRASAGFSDSFIISCDVCVAGTIGQLYAGVRLAGPHSEEGGFTGAQGDGLRHGGMSYWLGRVQMEAEGVPRPEPTPENPTPPIPSEFRDGEWHYHLNYDGTRSQWSGRDREGFSEIRLDFVFGQPIHLDLQLQTELLAAAQSGTGPGDGSAWATTNADYALLWNGISGIYTSQGEITDFRALNAQGVDYAFAAAVPEPSTWLLMLGGLAVLGRLAQCGASRRG